MSIKYGYMFDMTDTQDYWMLEAITDTRDLDFASVDHHSYKCWLRSGIVKAGCTNLDCKINWNLGQVFIYSRSCYTEIQNEDGVSIHFDSNVVDELARLKAHFKFDNEPTWLVLVFGPTCQAC